MHRHALFGVAAAATALALWAAPMRGQVAPSYEFRIIKVEDMAPGQYPKVIFAVLNAAGANWNIKDDPPFKSPVPGASRLFVQIGWSTRDYTNTGSGAAPALPIAIEALKASTEELGYPGLTYSVRSRVPVPATASGSGTAALEGHPAGQDATGAWTVRVPVKSAYKYFRITDASPVARREIVDINKCNACHGQLTLHGNNRTDEIRVCVMCHNANTTDITQRLAGELPETPIDFKRMVHAIHAGKMRHTPFTVMGFGHVLHDFSTVDFPGELSNCATCHLSGTYALPLGRDVLGTTVDTQSTFTETTPGTFTKTIDADPSNDLNISPTAAVCSACHDSPSVLDHMRRKGASFSATQSAIDTGVMRERCPTCHGPGRSQDVVRVHAEESGSGSSGISPERETERSRSLRVPRFESDWRLKRR